MFMMKIRTANLTLSSSTHGKARVRVAKVVRHEGGSHEIIELSVILQLVGGTDKSFTAGDNRSVVSTDTCRNHVYLHAKHTKFSTPEQFAITLSQRILNIYKHVDSVIITAVETPWRRAVVDGIHHRHGFIDTSTSGIRKCELTASRHSIFLSSTVDSLSVLKTTQSGWENYINDNFTTLPETNERILATTIDAKWSYKYATMAELLELPFETIHDKVKDALLLSFFGPAHGGVFSPGVQNSLYKMGGAVLQAVPVITSLTLSLPNLHFLPCNLPVMDKNELVFEHDVYIPTAEPHGVISATISRRPTAKL